MASAYNAIPAEPVLASSLLSGPESNTHQAKPRAGFSSSNWDLSLDISKGLYPPSKDDLFHPGKVLGFSKSRGRPNESNDEESVGELPRHLLTAWLSGQQNHPAEQPTKRTYIIHPQTSRIFSPQSLLTSLLSHQQYQQNILDARTHAISLLDTVTLFPVHDFASATDAIQDVANRLSSSPSAEYEGYEKELDTEQQTILIITGLDTLTESVIRSSNALRGAAVLSSALRTITQLSRGYANSLSILLVNTSGIGPTLYQTNQSNQSRQSHQQLHAGDDTHTHNAGAGGGNGIQSAFSASDTNLFPSLLMKSLDQGIDTHCLVSRVRNQQVIEVIKDRVGDGIGRWCVWSEKS